MTGRQPVTVWILTSSSDYDDIDHIDRVDQTDVRG